MPVFTLYRGRRVLRTKVLPVREGQEEILVFFEGKKSSQAAGDRAVVPLSQYLRERQRIPYTKE